MLLATLLFSVTYLCFMLVPGWLLASVLRISHSKLLLSIGLSVAITTFNLVLVRAIGVHFFWTAALIAAESLLLLLAALRMNSPASLTGGAAPDRYAGRVMFLVALSVGVYGAIAGPYLEVPADGWWHLAKINDILASFDADPGSAFSRHELWYAPNLYGYFLPALAAGLWDIAVIDVISPLNVINSVLFCTAVYAFALYVFGRPSLDPRYTVWCAAATVLFLVLQFGVNVFSFMRYYVYAPAFVNYLLYLSAVALLIETCRSGSWRVALPLFGLLSIAAYLVHKQEFMFVVLMASIIIAVEFLKSRRDVSAPNRGMAALLFTVMVAAWVVLWVASYTGLPRSNPLAYNTILPLERVLPFFRHLYIADPTFQFYEMVAVWGIAVYVLFFWALFRGERMPGFIVAGMLVPFVTVFNPLFVDLFLRHNYADVIWRSCFMIPLPFAGAWFFTRAVHGLIARRGRPLRSAVAYSMVAATLVVFLFPISSTFFESRNSRLYTVVPVSPTVEHGQWQDLFSFLNGVEKESVITDQVTGYMVNALTPHHYRGQKFYGFGATKIRRKHYDEGTFAEHAGSLLIVNQRDGGLSRTGRLSGHWPENILKVSRFYPQGLLTHIRSHPKRYRKIWDQRDVQVYQIQS